MSLDVHVGKNKSEAERSVAALSINENLHHILIIETATDGEYNQLLRLKDYYSDVVFTVADVFVLREELKRAFAALQNSEAITFVQNLIGICDQAIECGCNIYCFCD